MYVREGTGLNIDPDHRITFLYEKIVKQYRTLDVKENTQQYSNEYPYFS